MRRIAIINQKGGVGKTTTAVNLGAALARLGRRVVVVDMDPQANASMNLGAELAPEDPSTYSILTQGGRVADTLRGTSTPGLSILPSHLDLSGAELELASAIGRETILRDAFDEWVREEVARTGREPADVILIDNPPSLGLLSVNGLAASQEVLIAVQTEFFALQGLSKLVEIVQLLRRRMNPELEITGVLACLYDSRLRLAREVLGELRTHFPGVLYKRPIGQNVKLAETPSFARTIFEYAPESKGAEDYMAVAREFLEREGVEEHASGRSIEPPVRATAEPAPVEDPEPPTPETPEGAPSQEESVLSGEVAETGVEEPEEERILPQDDLAGLAQEIADVLAGRGGASDAPQVAAEPVVVADVDAAEDLAESAGAPATAPAPDELERAETSAEAVETDVDGAAAEEATEEHVLPLEGETAPEDDQEEAAADAGDELETVELIPAAGPELPEDADAQETSLEGEPEAEEIDPPGMESALDDVELTPATAPDGASEPPEGPAEEAAEADAPAAVALLEGPETDAIPTEAPEDTLPEVDQVDPEVDPAPEMVEEPVPPPARRRTPVSAAHAGRGEERASLPGRRGFSSDPAS